MKSTKGKRLRKGNAAILAAAVLVLAAGIGYGISTISPVRLYKNNPQVEIGDTFNARANISSVLFGNRADVQIRGTVDTQVPGSYAIEYIYNGHTLPITVEVADFTPPELELRPLTIGMEDEVDAESFVVSCTDSSKVSLSIDNPNNLNTTKGTRTISITALDEFGNTTTRSTQLTRIEDSTTPSVRNTQSERRVLIHTAFEPTELDIEENTDVECTIDVNTTRLDMDTVGTYTVYYTVTDSSGNSVRWEETVHVLEDLNDPLPEKQSNDEEDADWEEDDEDIVNWDEEEELDEDSYTD